MAVLVLADHDLGVLSPSTARLVAAGSLLGPVDVLVAGEGIDAVALEAAKIAGVTKVLVAQGFELQNPLGDILADLLAGLAQDYGHIIAGANAVGRDVIPRLAGKLDIMPVTDVVAIHGSTRFERPVYAGNAVETVVSNQPKQLLTVRASAFRPAAMGNAAPVSPVPSSGLKSAAKLIAVHRTQSDAPDLSSAQIVVGGGIALGSAEGFKQVEALARRLGAAVGATRAAVDAGYAPNDWQVGQTGKIIAPDLYIAVGISGALQHLAGIQGAKKIIAINKDADAPLVKIADYALIGDLFEILPALDAELARLGVQR